MARMSMRRSKDLRAGSSAASSHDGIRTSSAGVFSLQTRKHETQARRPVNADNYRGWMALALVFVAIVFRALLFLVLSFRPCGEICGVGLDVWASA